MEVLAALIGAGIVAASPFVPVLRPVAKAAVKGGLAVSEAVVGAAVVVGHQVNEAVTKSKAESETTDVEEIEVVVADDIAADQDAEATLSGEETDINEQGIGLASLATALRPTAETAVKVGVAVTDKAKEAVVAAGKQWSDLVAEAKESQDKADQKPVVEAELAVQEEPDVEVQPEIEQEPVVEAQTEVQAQADVEVQPEIQEAPQVETPVEPLPVPDVDDLTQIYGIGPKTASLLEKAGITSYAQLAAADEAQLRLILNDAGGRYRSINPADWPERAQQLI